MGVQGVIDFQQTGESLPQEDLHKLLEYFGTLDCSILALFEAMSGGISWGELVVVLRPLPLLYTMIFLFFICVSIFAVVNIVTGVFVENAMHSAQKDKDTIVQDEVCEKQEYVKRIRGVFQDMDIDDRGEITLERFEDAVQDENMHAYLTFMGLDINEVRTLFFLLDRDQTGCIDIEEFLVGCLRLKGEARGLDMAKLLYEVEFLVHVVEGMSGQALSLVERGEKARGG